MLNKSDFILYLQESWKRFWSKTPKYFRVLGTVSVIMSGIGFIPDFLEFIGVQLPASWLPVLGKLMIGAGIYGKIVSRMVTSVPSPDKMPFTEKKNIEKIVT